MRTLGAAALTAMALAVPSTARAADEEPLFAALSERNAAGKVTTHPIRPGETVPVVLGVANVGSAPAPGVIVNIRTYDDVNLPRTFSNCLYYTDSNVEGAWCEIDAELAADRRTYALTSFQVAAADPAAKLPAIVFQWFPTSFADKSGGIEKLAAQYSGQGSTPVRGTGDTLGLAPQELTIPTETSRVGFAYVKLVTPSATPTRPTSGPTSASPAPTSPAPTSPSAGAGAGGTGDGGTGAGDGGLPVTGSNTAVIAGLGGVLLAAGALGLLVARRRTRFVP
ncbi:hypothetical protein Ate01nite_16860 [Actinoplanes teichomyceticus]|nr:hypothetical protein Ate01nite_16860 [Actinoplanes teichomyceticus]